VSIEGRVVDLFFLWKREWEERLRRESGKGEEEEEEKEMDDKRISRLFKGKNRQSLLVTCDDKS
jgi:hypothetical protein